MKTLTKIALRDQSVTRALRKRPQVIRIRRPGLFRRLMSALCAWLEIRESRKIASMLCASCGSPLVKTVGSGGMRHRWCLRCNARR